MNQSFLKGPFNDDIDEFPADHTSQNDSSSAISKVKYFHIETFRSVLIDKQLVMHSQTAAYIMLTLQEIQATTIY